MKTPVFITALFLYSNSAFAQSEPLAGFVVGAQGGADFKSVEYSVGSTPFTDKETSFVYGAFAGYDLSLDRMRIGIQAEISQGSGELQADDNAGTQYIVDSKWSYAFAGRIGTLIGENSIVYGRAGYAAERSRVVFTGPTILSVPVTRWDDGFLLGGGFETEIPQGLTARVEYRYRDLSNKLASHQILVGVGYRF